MASECSESRLKSQCQCQRPPVTTNLPTDIIWFSGIKSRAIHHSGESKSESDANPNAITRSKAPEKHLTLIGKLKSPVGYCTVISLDSGVENAGKTANYTTCMMETSELAPSLFRFFFVFFLVEGDFSLDGWASQLIDWWRTSNE